MAIRKRSWITAKGERREAWVVDYADRQGDRHIETFTTKREASSHEAQVKVDMRAGIHVAPSKSPTVALAGAS